MLKAVILDWAGTVVDHGSRAPMGAFVRAFAEFGVAVSIADARGPMGMAKRDHIAAMMALPHVAQAWHAARVMRHEADFFGESEARKQVADALFARARGVKVDGCGFGHQWIGSKRKIYSIFNVSITRIILDLF